MSFQPLLTESLSLAGEIKVHISHKDMFVDPAKSVIDDSHIHNCYEIYVNISGNVSFLHGDNIYKIKSGDVIFSEPGEVHHCIYSSACVHGHYCLWFEIEESSPISRFLKKHRIDGHIRLEERNKEKLLFRLSELKRNGDEFERSVAFLEIIKLLSEREKISYDEEGVTIPNKMKTILEYVNDKYLEIDSVNSIARKFHVSVPTVNRWFANYLNLSPGELIRAKKLSYAEKLIRSDHSVTDACFLAGFTDCSRFIKLFKRNYGKTPLRYKKELGYDSE